MKVCYRLLFLKQLKKEEKNLFRLLCCSNITEMMTTVSLQIVGIIEPIIQHADWFFPGGERGPNHRKELFVSQRK